jgi:hypothetical protein
MTQGIGAPALGSGRPPGATAARGRVVGTLGALLALFLAGTGAARAGGGPAAAPGVAAATGTAASPACEPLAGFDPAGFTRSTEIDNRWLPWVPGTAFVLQGLANRGRGLLPHRVVTVVTDLTKVVAGVRARVLVELDINAGQLEEAELAFHAQDDAGNVWNLGEYPEEYEDGAFSDAPDVWVAGVAGAEAGVLVPAEPRLGTPAYRQGFAPGIGFFDCGRVLNTGARTCVPGKCHKDVAVVDEWDPLDPEGGHQRKFQAAGVGVVRVGAVNDPEAETLVLREVRRLGPRRLAQARELAHRLEKRAYEISAAYRHTSPLE